MGMVIRVNLNLVSGAVRALVSNSGRLSGEQFEFRRPNLQHTPHRKITVLCQRLWVALSLSGR